MLGRDLHGFSVGALLCGLIGCSLGSLDALNRCAGEQASAECPPPAADGGSVSGGGAGATGGLGGTDTGGSDTLGAGAGGRAVALELVVLYADRSSEDPEPSTESKSIRPVFVIENRGVEPVLLAELRLRYYYRLEAAKPELFECEFVHPDEIVNDCDGVLGSFGTVSSSEASHYFEVSFAPPAEVWSLPAFGGQSGRILVRAFKEGFARQDQTNDYSYDPTQLEPLSAWDRVSLYRNDQLVFGAEPE